MSSRALTIKCKEAVGEQQKLGCNERQAGGNDEKRKINEVRFISRVVSGRKRRKQKRPVVSAPCRLPLTVTHFPNSICRRVERRKEEKTLPDFDWL